MTSAKNIKFFGLTIALLSTRGSKATKTIVKLPNKLKLPKTQPGNFLVSPLSVEVVLGLTLTGAKGATSKEIAGALLLPRQPDRIQQAFKELGQYFKGNENYVLSSTNKIYVQDGAKINKKFREVASTSFKANIQNINFQNKNETIAEINAWVEKETKHKIMGTMENDFLGENIRMALINTIYFKGRPSKQFSRVTAGQGRFFINKSDYIETSMLESIGYFNYCDNAKLKAKLLELPYQGHDITATLVLPNEKTGLVSMETHIAEFFLIPPYKRESVHVRIPKCRINSTINFNDILQGLGVKEAFKDSADFSELLENAEPLKISGILHKTFIDGEELKQPALIGTRLLETTANPSSLIQPRNFYANHPFVFYLQHKVTGVFFVGRLYRVDGVVKSIPTVTRSQLDKLKTV